MSQIMISSVSYNQGTNTLNLGFISTSLATLNDDNMKDIMDATHAIKT